MKLQVSPSVQEEADYYVVLVGSSLHHVTTAHRAEDQGSIKFTVPGETLNKSQSVIDVYRAMLFFECVKACKIDIYNDNYIGWKNYSNAIVALCHYRYRCGVGLPIFIELE